MVFLAIVAHLVHPVTFTPCPYLFWILIVLLNVVSVIRRLIFINVKEEEFVTQRQLAMTVAQGLCDRTNLQVAAKRGFTRT